MLLGRAVTKSDYMLGHPSIPRYSPTPTLVGSENAPGADNQQERLELRLENPQRPYARHPTRRMMRWSPLHGDMQWTSSKEVMSSSDVSE